MKIIYYNYNIEICNSYENNIFPHLATKFEFLSRVIRECEMTHIAPSLVQISTQNLLIWVGKT